MPRRTWTPEIIQDARRAIEGGETAGSVAQRLGLSSVALRNAFLRNGLQTPGAYAPKPADVAPPTPAEVLEEHRHVEGIRKLRRDQRALLKELQECKDALEEITTHASLPLPPVQRRELGGGKREATAVALLSDVHAETLVKPGDTPYGNAYNLPIAALRLARFFDSILWQVKHARSAFHIRTLILAIMGDLGSGDIHPEITERAQLGPNSTWLWLWEHVGGGIDKLLRSNAFEEVLVPWSYGNHGRTTETMRCTTGAEHNREWLLGKVMARQYEGDDRITFLVDPSEHQFAEVYGLKLHFHHGHRVRYAGGVLGVGVPAAKAVAGWARAQRCDRNYFAHYHTHTMPTSAIVMNGSCIGFDGYAHSLKAEPEPPQQHFELLDSKRGPCMMTPLWVGDPEREAELWEAP